MIEVRPRDLLQIIVGASLLAVPVAFTEETWNLGINLPLANVGLLGMLSVLFLSLFAAIIVSLVWGYPFSRF